MFIVFPLFVTALGGTESTIGWVLGIGVAASVAARPLVGTWLDRVGRRRLLLWGNGLNALSYLPFLVIGTVGPALVVCVVAHDLLWGLLFASYFTYAADLVPAARRAEGIAIFGVFGMASNGLAPALGERMIAWGGFPAFFLTASALGGVAFLLTFALVEEPPRPLPIGDVRLGVLRSMREAVRAGRLGLLLVATALLGAGINSVFVYVAPFTRHLGLKRAAPFFLAYAGASIAVRIVGRRVPDLLGPQRIAAPAFLLYAFGLALLCLAPRPGALSAAGAAGGMGHGTLFPVLNALAVTRTPIQLHGTVVSLVTATLDLGAVVGTPLCGLIAHVTGYAAMFATMAMASLFGAALMLLDRRGRR